MAAERVKFPPKRFSDLNGPLRDCEEHILQGKDKEGFSVIYINDEIGKGVFTTKDFRRGDFLLEYPGELISVEEARKREKRYPSKLGSFLFFFNSKKVQLCIDATFSNRKGKYINDGFGGTQNAEVKLVNVGGRNHLASFATRNIKSGEQVLYDYGVPSLPWRKPVINFCKKKDSKNGEKKTKDTHTDPGELCEKLESPNTEQADILPERSQNEIASSSVDYDPQSEKDLQNADANCDLKEDKSSSETHSTAHKSPPMELLYLMAQPGYDSVLLTWDSPESHIDEYYVMVKEDDCCWEEERVSSSTKDYRVPNLKPETTYCFAVTAANAAGRGPCTEIRSVCLKKKPEMTDRIDTDVEHVFITYGKLNGNEEQLSLDNDEVNSFDKRDQSDRVFAGQRSISNIADDSVIQDNQDTDTNRNEPCDFVIETDDVHTVAAVGSRCQTEESVSEHLVSTGELPEVISERQKSRNPEQADSISKRSQSETPSTSVYQAPQSEEELQNIDADCDLKDDTSSLVTLSITHKSELSKVIYERRKNRNTEQTDSIPERSQSETPSTSVYQEPQSKEDLHLQKNDADCHLKDDASSSETPSIAHKNITSRTKQKEKTKKPHRPCPYCHAFKSALSDHIKRRHSQEEVVKRALILPKSARIRAFRQMKKNGIMKANMQLVEDKKNKKGNVNMIRERKPSSTKAGKLIYCSKCYGFICSKYFSQHRKYCMSADATSTLPQSIPIDLFCEPGGNADYQREILKTFKLDAVGQLCITDKLIVGFGNREYKTIRNHKDKKEERRSTLKTGMRRLGNLYNCFKEKCRESSVTTSSSIDMFKRNNFKILEDTIYTLTTEDDGKVRNGLKLGFGYILRKVCKYLHGEFLIKGEDDEALEIDRFLAVLNYHWGTLFGDAEYAAVIKRQSILRKPHNLPSEEDIKMLKDFTVQKIQDLVADEYIFMASSEYSLLRDLVVSRLTLFNARRGGEPSRLLLQEWEDAKCNTWYKDTEPVNDPLEKMLMGRFKLAYQSGKRVKLVPLLIMDDCWKAMEILTDPENRKQANVYSENIFVFPLTRFSTGHVTGWQAVEKCCGMAGLATTITATSMRHYVATVYAGLEVSDEERKRFYDHMGHTEAINKDVYQSPLAVKEITQVGRFLHQLDRGELLEVIYERQKNRTTEQTDSLPERSQRSQSDTTSTSVHQEPQSEEDLQNIDADCDLKEDDTSSSEALSIAHNGELPEVIYARHKNRNSEQADSILERSQRELASTSFHQSDEDLQNPDAYCELKDVTSSSQTLSIAHKSCSQIVLKNLKLSRDVIRSPAAPLNLNVTCSSAKILLSWEEPKDDGGLQINGYSVMMKEDRNIWHEKARLEKNIKAYTVETLQPEKAYYFAVHAVNSVGKGPPAGLKSAVILRRKSEKRIYRPWAAEDTAAINKYFQRYIENTSDLTTNSGPLPGVKELKAFTEQHPGVLKGVPICKKITRIKSKIFNDRKELRRKMGVTEGKL